mmetsp:Transcript_8231/g.14878  ORF Transcript_8231/g.14878 Transcript_8231/m.14878 type:complete len:282 (+) Transcript_8231:72-917(+)
MRLVPLQIVTSSLFLSITPWVSFFRILQSKCRLHRRRHAIQCIRVQHRRYSVHCLTVQIPHHCQEFASHVLRIIAYRMRQLRNALVCHLVVRVRGRRHQLGARTMYRRGRLQCPVTTVPATKDVNNRVGDLEEDVGYCNDESDEMLENLLHRHVGDVVDCGHDRMAGAVDDGRHGGLYVVQKGGNAGPSDSTKDEIQEFNKNASDELDRGDNTIAKVRERGVAHVFQGQPIDDVAGQGWRMNVHFGQGWRLEIHLRQMRLGQLHVGQCRRFEIQLGQGGRR